MSAVKEEERGMVMAGTAPGAVAVEQAEEDEDNGSSHGAGRFSAPSREAASVWEEVATLRRQVRELEALVSAQGEVTERQRRAIEEMKRAAGLGANGASRAGGDIVDSHTPLEARALGVRDRRFGGLFDARFHSLSRGAIPHDHRVLPDRIILVRHAQSEGNVNKQVYSHVPDQRLGLTDRGWDQATEAGNKIRRILECDGQDFKLFFFLSPYRRSYETYEGIRQKFSSEEVIGACEEVQLREQDFGNFQEPGEKTREMAERMEFGRFFYRFPNGESGADVYDRITIFEDHFVRDILESLR